MFQRFVRLLRAFKEKADGNVFEEYGLLRMSFAIIGLFFMQGSFTHAQRQQKKNKIILISSSNIYSFFALIFSLLLGAGEILVLVFMVQGVLNKKNSKLIFFTAPDFVWGKVWQALISLYSYPDGKFFFIVSSSAHGALFLNRQKT